ncbi:response regulator transcription factor [Streptomyces sp. NPDC020917]|uniref:response regulator transcription factor n=1 Tax=Streptomyces sp. NPDC020917 TaxID=3365102 RepID=UPI0037B758E0
MTGHASPVPALPARVRIAITSPDILAQIRQVFASKNLAVEIVRLPYVEVTVRPAAGTAPSTGQLAAAAHERAAGAVPAAPPAAARRLCAEYRLNVVETAATLPVRDRPRPADAGRTAAEPGPAARLSRRQHEVMALVSRGVRNAEIADRLGLTEKTVKNHLNRIFRTLGARSRIEAVLLWQRHGAVIRPGGPDPRPAPHQLEVVRPAPEPEVPRRAPEPGPRGTPGKEPRPAPAVVVRPMPVRIPRRASAGTP